MPQWIKSTNKRQIDHPKFIVDILINMIYNVNKDWKGDMMFNNKIKELQQELFNKQDEIDRLKISLSQTKDIKGKF